MGHYITVDAAGRVTKHVSSVDPSRKPAGAIEVRRDHVAELKARPFSEWVMDDPAGDTVGVSAHGQRKPTALLRFETDVEKGAREARGEAKREASRKASRKAEAVAWLDQPGVAHLVAALQAGGTTEDVIADAKRRAGA